MEHENSLIGLEGKVALVTGGGAGIGLAIASLLVRAGMKIVVAEIDPAHAASARAILAKLVPDHLVIVADVREAEQVTHLLNQVREQHGRLDVVVNNVGDFLRTNAPFEQTTESQRSALYMVLLHHVFLVTRAAIPLMKAAGHGGSIINISTIEAFRGIPLLAVYSAFKAALTGCTQRLAVELGQHGIRVNAIAPATTNSVQITATSREPPENQEAMKRWFPVGRFGGGSDTAGAALYLASD